MLKHGILVSLAVWIAIAGQARGETLTNNGDSWVRESDPDNSFLGDLISVWNSLSSDGSRRYGIISFDLGSLTEPVGSVSLSLWSQVNGFSDDDIPLKQTAIAIDPAGIAGDAATWTQVTSAATLHSFDTLGAYDIGATSATPELQDVFLESVGTAVDAAFVESVRTGSGTLMIVMIADPDVTNYGKSWSDGEFNGQDAFLSTNGDVMLVQDPNIEVDEELAFGQVTLGEGPFVQTLTISNTGQTEVLTVSSATITGTDAAHFAVTGGTFPVLINPGESADIDLTFDPGLQTGAFEATMELASDDPGDAVVAVALSGTSEAPSEAMTLINNGDSWVRESAADNQFPGDLMSVWSSLSSDGARRFGVVSFDLTSLNEPVRTVSLSLWSEAFGFSDDALPLKQTAIAIDPAGIDPDAATWTQVAAAATLHTFEGLGAVDIGAPGLDPKINGVFVESAGTPADASFVESVRAGSGSLMIVMIADEDEASNYSGSWGDGELGGEDAFLSIELGGLGFRIVEIRPNLASGEVSFDFTSRPGADYVIEASNDLNIWLELDDSYPSGGELSTFTELGLDPAPERRFYRVRAN